MRISDWSSYVCSSDLMILSHSALLTDPSRPQSSAAMPRACLASNHSARPIGSTVTRRAILPKVQPRVTDATAISSPDSAKWGAVHPQIGRAHVCTPVTNAHLVCRLLLEQKNTH